MKNALGEAKKMASLPVHRTNKTYKLNRQQGDNMSRRTSDFKNFIQDRVHGNLYVPSREVYTTYTTFHSIFGRVYWNTEEDEHRNAKEEGLGYIDTIISPKPPSFLRPELKSL